MRNTFAEGSVCRRCEELAVVSAAASGRRSFVLPSARKQYAPDLPFRLEHIRLDVTVDPKGKTMQGVATQKVRAVAPGQRQLKLDQIGLQIEAAKVDGKDAPFEVEGNSLTIRLAREPAPGDTLEFSVRYRVRDPNRGLYFTGPDAHYPKKPYQVWSQGQDEDSRYWFPTFDYPNQKATSEIIATVPKGFTAVSNGALLERKDVPEGTRFHYKLGVPHVTYLVTLVVAEFSEWADEGPRKLPVQYFVQPGREADGKRAFGNTPKMIEAYERKIGVPYAYEKYSQAAVQDFIFGGMENTSATTQTDLVMHDERAHLDFSGDPLVSHELAHQWFGDLLTCRDWSHGWLNEGFATFMERVWIESNPGEGGGEDEAKYYGYMDLKEHMDEDAHSYRRPIVSNTYIEPIDLFDAHLYQKGGLVLNLLRHVLGEDSFWKTIGAYVTRHRGQNVETIDLIRAIEDTTGRNLRRFFDEWVFGAGYPEFELSYEWHDDRKLAELVIEQKQTGGQPSVTEADATTHLFHLPVTIELTLDGGKKLAHRIEVGEARDRVFLPCESKPRMVRFDPGANIPKTLKFPRPKELLLNQLTEDADVMGRIEAAHELGKVADLAIVEALGKALLAEKFWGVQVEIAHALAGVRLDTARDALVAALGAKHPKARRGIVQALGKFRDETAANALRKLAEKDASYYVEAEATLAWAQARSFAGARADDAETARTEAFLLEQLGKESYREVIRCAALRALATLPGVGRGERPKAMAALIDWSRPGKPMDARMAAVAALGLVARSAGPVEASRIQAVLGELAGKEGFRVHMALVGALRATESADAIAALETIRQREPDGRAKRRAITAIDELRASGTTPESVTKMRAALEKLEEDYRKLRGELETLKGRGTSA